MPQLSLPPFSPAQLACCWCGLRASALLVSERIREKRPNTGLLVAPSPFPTSAATSMQCLNVTRLPPSRRNAAAGGLDCAYKVATIGTQTCPKGVTFNPDKLRHARELTIELCCCRGDSGWRVGPPENLGCLCLPCSRAATTLLLTSTFPCLFRTCLFNNGGQPATGVCDPDGHCYDVYTHTQAVNTLKVGEG